MSHHKEEKIYTQSDMEEVLAQVQGAKKEAERAHQLLWLAIHVAGGSIHIPHALWMGDEIRELKFQDDPVNLMLEIEAVDDEDDDV